jgi:hypothetical protein
VIYHKVYTVVERDKNFNEYSLTSRGESGIQEYKVRTVYSIWIQNVGSGSERLDRSNVSYHSCILHPRGHPGEAVELGLIACSQLTVHGCQSRLLFRKLLIEIAGIRTSILPIVSLTRDGDMEDMRRTIVGK